MMLTPEQLWLDRRDKMNLTELKACGDAMARKIQENTASLLAAADYINKLEQMLSSGGQRIAELEKDAARYRWLRNPNQRIDSVIDKRVGELSSGMGIWEYKAGEELDAAIDAAMQPTWPEDTSDYGSRIAIVGQNGNDGLAYQEEQP